MKTPYIAALCVALVLNASANLMMRAGMKQVQAAGGLLRDGVAHGLWTILSSGVLMAGLVFFALNALFYMFALQKLQVSVAYPIMVSGGFAIIATVAFLTMGERMSALQWFGVAVILIGVLMVAVPMSKVQ
jgi:multidrug transporter EmrE-like cation transporter